MRSVATIQKLYGKYSEMFEGDAPVDIEANLDAAFEILNISRADFEQIPTAALQREFLEYKIGIAEFEFNPCRYVGSEFMAGVDFMMGLATGAHQAILKSRSMRNHNTEYSNHSQGLWFLHQYLSEKKVKDLNESGMEQTHLLRTDEKDSGVEPGYKGVPRSVIVAAIRAEYADEKQRQQFIEKHNANFKEVFKVLQERNVINQSMVKGTYKQKSSKDKVTPEKSDLARAGTIKKIPEPWRGPALEGFQQAKAKPRLDIIKEYVFEVLANDIARLFMPVQEQMLVMGQYDDGAPQIYSISKWENDLNSLQGEDGYLAHKVEQSGIKRVSHISDLQIDNMGSCLPLFLALGDRDSIGSNYQNKARKDDKLFGLDFGKAFTTELASSVANNFSFPFDKFECKNYSAFYNSSRTEFMKGMLRLAKLYGLPLDDDIINSYGTGFVNELANIEINADIKIFEDYINFFTKLSKSKDYKEVYQDEFLDIARAIESKKDRHISERNILLAKFKHYFDFTKELVELTENIEKLHYASNKATSMLSPNGKVLLEHMRVTKPNSKLSWSVTPADSDYTLALSGISNPEQLLEVLKAHLREQGVDVNALMMSHHYGVVTITIPKNKLSSVCSALQESNLQKKFHKDHYDKFQELSTKVRAEQKQKLEFQHKLDQFKQKSEKLGFSKCKLVEKEGRLRVEFSIARIIDPARVERSVELEKFRDLEKFHTVLTEQQQKRKDELKEAHEKDKKIEIKPLQEFASVLDALKMIFPRNPERHNFVTGDTTAAGTPNTQPNEGGKEQFKFQPKTLSFSINNMQELEQVAALLDEYLGNFDCMVNNYVNYLVGQYKPVIANQHRFLGQGHNQERALYHDLMAWQCDNKDCDITSDNVQRLIQIIENRRPHSSSNSSTPGDTKKDGPSIDDILIKLNDIKGKLESQEENARLADVVKNSC